jgi:hypothetical protein
MLLKFASFLLNSFFETAPPKVILLTVLTSVGAALPAEVLALLEILSTILASQIPLIALLLFAFPLLDSLYPRLVIFNLQSLHSQHLRLFIIFIKLFRHLRLQLLNVCFILLYGGKIHGFLKLNIFIQFLLLVCHFIELFSIHISLLNAMAILLLNVHLLASADAQLLQYACFYKLLLRFLVLGMVDGVYALL